MKKPTKQNKRRCPCPTKGCQLLDCCHGCGTPAGHRVSWEGIDTYCTRCNSCLAIKPSYERKSE